MVTETVTGLDNLVIRFQGEHAFTLTIKGFTYDYASGGAYPSNATLFTGTNWDYQMSDVKAGPGVMMQVA